MALANRGMWRGEGAVEPRIGADRSQRSARLVLAEKVDIKVARHDNILFSAGQRNELREVLGGGGEVRDPRPDIGGDDNEG
eukprot:9793470-Alexandrium_andersonii.AAC.1